MKSTALFRAAFHGCCTYCDRRLNAFRRNDAPTSATRDHVDPKSRGGKVKVLCCKQCNQLKGDLSPAQWRTFTFLHPYWWKTFKTAKQVRDALAVADAQVRVA